MRFWLMAQGKGLAAILGIGAIILATLGKSEWKFFLGTSIVLWFVIFFKRSRDSNYKENKHRDYRKWKKRSH